MLNTPFLLYVSSFFDDIAIFIIFNYVVLICCVIIFGIVIGKFFKKLSMKEHFEIEPIYFAIGMLLVAFTLPMPI